MVLEKYRARRQSAKDIKSQQQELMALHQKMKAMEQSQREGLPLYHDVQKDSKQGEHGNATTHFMEVNHTSGNAR